MRWVKISIVIVAAVVTLMAYDSRCDAPEPDCLTVTSGDINLDNRAYDTGDVFLFIDFFMYGDTVFSIDKKEQIYRTDINLDGRYLTLNDLDYLTRIILGDARPPSILPKTIDTVSIYINEDTLSLYSKTDLGAALFVFNGDIDFDLLDSVFQVKFDYVSGKTRILLYSFDGAKFNPGITPLLKSSDLQTLDSCVFSGYYGNRVVTRMPERK